MSSMAGIHPAQNNSSASPKTSEVIDARWVKYECASYFKGRGLVFGGGGGTPTNPQAFTPGQYSINITPSASPQAGAVEKDLKHFEGGEWDYVFLGISSPQSLVVQAEKCLRVGGHLILHSSTPYTPSSGEWKIKTHTSQTGGWVWVGKLLSRSKNKIHLKLPLAQKTACVVRYGAIGDMIMVIPLLKQLHNQGYHITVNTSPYCKEVLVGCPYVHNVVLQEKDMIPNPELEEYWNYWRTKYDVYINLSESIEGSMLKVEGRPDFYWPKSLKQSQLKGHNYYERTLKLGGVDTSKLSPKEFRGELFISRDEYKCAQRWVAKNNPKNLPMIMWALNGSSFHKAYPFMIDVVQELNEQREVLWVFVGDHKAAPMVPPLENCINLAGKTTLRETFALIPQMQVVVGPESAVTNAGGCFENPLKVVFMSHSSPEQLTKYWPNTIALEPSLQGAPCYPCHQLHYSLESCPQSKVLGEGGEVELVGPSCTTAIPPSVVVEAIKQGI